MTRQFPDSYGALPVSGDPGTLPRPERAYDTHESVTQLIGEVRGGRSEAWDRIYTLLYKDLYQIARTQIYQQHGHSRSPTALINETWLRLANADFNVVNRSHLVSLIARTMRFVLLDEVRRKLAEKRGQGAELLSLDETNEPGIPSKLEQLLILGQALDELAEMDARLVQVVEMRYFGGLNEAEIASVLKVTERTVRRDWRRARAFLSRHLGDEEETGGAVPQGI